MHIQINVTFNHGRCFFNGFTEENDINPNTGKAGVNYYRFHLIGFILTKLGFARVIHCFENDKPRIVYVNTKSFLKWRERHSKDKYITSMKPEQVEKHVERLAQYIQQAKDYEEYTNNPKMHCKEVEGYSLKPIPKSLDKTDIYLIEAYKESLDLFRRSQKLIRFGNDFESSIRFIVKTYKSYNQFIIRNYKTLSYEKVMEKAQQEIPEGPRKQKKIQKIKDALEKCHYKESYAKRKTPEIGALSNYIEERQAFKIDGVINEDARENCEIDSFLSTLPGTLLIGDK